MHKQVTITNIESEHIPTPGVPGRSVTAGTVPAALGPFNANTRYVLMQVQDAPVRLTYGGDTPAAGTGFLHPAGTLIKMNTASADAVRLVRAGSADAAVYLQESTR